MSDIPDYEAAAKELRTWSALGGYVTAGDVRAVVDAALGVPIEPDTRLQAIADAWHAMGYAERHLARKISGRLIAAIEDAIKKEDSG